MRPPAAPTPNAAGGTVGTCSDAIKFRCPTRAAASRGQLRLSAEGRALRYPGPSPPLRMACARHPLPVQVQPPVHQGRTAAPQVGRVHRDLAVGPLARLAAVLPRHPRRLDSILGDVGTVDGQHPLISSQRGRHQFPVRRQDRRVVPARFAQEQLLCAHRVRVGPAQPQDHALDRLVPLVPRQPPQLAAAEEGRVARLVGSQPAAHRGDVGAAHGHVGQGDRGGGQGHGGTGAEGIQTP